MGDPEAQTLSYDETIARRVWAAHHTKPSKELTDLIPTVSRVERPYVRLLQPFLHTPWVRGRGTEVTEAAYLAFVKPRVEGKPPERGDEDPSGGRKRRRTTQKRKATQKRRKSRRTH